LPGLLHLCRRSGASGCVGSVVRTRWMFGLKPELGYGRCALARPFIPKAGTPCRRRRKVAAKGELSKTVVMYEDDLMPRRADSYVSTRWATLVGVKPTGAGRRANSGRPVRGRVLALILGSGYFRLRRTGKAQAGLKRIDGPDGYACGGRGPAWPGGPRPDAEMTRERLPRASADHRDKLFLTFEAGLARGLERWTR